jgi:hypothetical protein
VGQLGCPTDEWIKKIWNINLYGVYMPYIPGLLPSYEEKLNSAICRKMDGTGVHHAE